jgi:hypothetical protein
MNASWWPVKGRVAAGNYPQPRRCYTKKGHIVGAEFARLAARRCSPLFCNPGAVAGVWCETFLPWLAMEGMYRPLRRGEILLELEYHETREMIGRNEQPGAANLGVDPAWRHTQCVG